MILLDLDHIQREVLVPADAMQGRPAARVRLLGQRRRINDDLIQPGDGGRALAEVVEVIWRHDDYDGGW